MINEKTNQSLGLEALKYINNNNIVGIGTGSTINCFIKLLDAVKHKIKGVVSSSKKSSKKLKNLNMNLLDLNKIDILDIYIDSADEVNTNMQMIKGKGAALTKEKIIATVAKKFICIIDSNKFVNILGKSPLPIEIIPMAKNLVSKELVKLGGLPIYRKGVITDNGNIILDIYKLKFNNPIILEEKINNITGVVTVGLFARRRADVLIISNEKQEIKIIKRNPIFS